MNTTLVNTSETVKIDTTAVQPIVVDERTVLSHMEERPYI